MYKPNTTNSLNPKFAHKDTSDTIKITSTSYITYASIIIKKGVFKATTELSLE